MDEEFRKLVKAFERTGDKAGYLNLFTKEELSELIINASLKLFLEGRDLKVIRTDAKLTYQVGGSIFNTIKKEHLNLDISPATAVISFDWPNLLRYLDHNKQANTIFIPKDLVLHSKGSPEQYWMVAKTTELTPEVIKKKHVASEKRKQSKIKRQITKLQNKVAEAERLKTQLKEAKAEAEKAGIKLEELENK